MVECQSSPPTAKQSIVHPEQDLEEAYILSAFRSEPAVCGAKPWAQLDEEKGLPSVESLRATLQALRAQDRSFGLFSRLFWRWTET